MPLRPCLTCGVLLTHGNYCAGHEPVSASRQTVGRDNGAAAEAFRRQVLARAGDRCEWIGSDGVTDVRCTATLNLEVHGVPLLADGGTNHPHSGVALCRHHHRLAERMTRRAA